MNKWVWLGCCLLSSMTAAADLSELHFITEDYPPYNYKRNGEVHGISVDILSAIFEASGLRLPRESIRLLPWARGYETALKEPNTVLFSTTRTPSREALFQWVGPIARDRVTLIARRDRGLSLGSIPELNASSFQVAVIREDIGAQRLEEAGADPGRIISAISNASALMMLDRGRVDLWAYSEDVAFWIIEEQGLDVSDYESILTLSESSLYFALNPATDATLVASLQSGLDTLRERGTLNTLLERQ
ncbi:substrate-binding periplasmic protein [Litchfieldella xinjiangensis]|uniref:substrate-binding periplasmic protein n=1 Tax=Litchfieldella xinjiangensis TaxID=1166948 RepID=UPI0005B801A6|nr:transporter substrate-binding domain-containing protein [Halomonas xinjiangensis]